MKTYLVVYALGFSGLYNKIFKAKDENQAYAKAQKYASNIILRVEEVTE